MDKSPSPSPPIGDKSTSYIRPVGLVREKSLEGSCPFLIELSGTVSRVDPIQNPKCFLTCLGIRMSHENIVRMVVSPDHSFRECSGPPVNTRRDVMSSNFRIGQSESSILILNPQTLINSFSSNSSVLETSGAERSFCSPFCSSEYVSSRYIVILHCGQNESNRTPIEFALNLPSRKGLLHLEHVIVEKCTGSNLLSSDQFK